MINTLKKNMRNKTWWVAFISAMIVLCKVWGIDLTDYIGKDWLNTVNSICTIAILLGISVDTTSVNVGGANNENVEPIQESTEKAEDVPTVTDNTQAEKPYYDARMEQLKTLIDQANIILKE
jgi:uncharacterized membrane protein